MLATKPDRGLTPYRRITFAQARVPLPHLCVSHSSDVPFPALTLCNGTVIRHTESRKAVFGRFFKKTTSLHENRISAKSTNASEFGRSTSTVLIDTSTHHIMACRFHI